MRPVRRATFFIAAGAALLVSCSAISFSDDKKLEVGGTVYAAMDANHNPTGPVAGATVSTSVDATTTTTDAGGNFHLVTNTPRAGFSCTPYTVTVTAAGHPTFSVTGKWGGLALNQTIIMSPPSPGSINGSGC